ncbi:MAG TPA: YafY family protein [Puia sp.]|nr:YafY family protein [Puia sp.]
MNRIDRLHAILTHLQSKKRVTAQEMADRFNISLRTVYRDVKALDESGVPVIGEAGSGYTIMEGYRLPPVMFTQEEASALLLGSKLAEQFTDDSIRRHFGAALFKIKAVLRTTDKEHVDSLTDHIAVYGKRPAGGDGLAPQYLSLLQQAIVGKRVLHLQYQAVGNEAATVRDVEPIGLIYYGSNWHLIAWCRLRNDYRDFRSSRILRASLTEDIFNGSSHPSVQEYLKKIMADSKSELQEVVVCFDKGKAKYIGEQKYLYGFVSEEDLGLFLRMKFLVSSLTYFSRWLLMFTDSVRIESPDALKGHMQELAEKAYTHHR